MDLAFGYAVDLRPGRHCSRVEQGIQQGPKCSESSAGSPMRARRPRFTARRNDYEVLYSLRASSRRCKAGGGCHAIERRNEIQRCGT